MICMRLSIKTLFYKKLFHNMKLSALYCCVHNECNGKQNSKENNFQTKSKLINWKNEATLYIHWPYCEKRCTYCNFNKYISKNVNYSRMSACLIKELKYLIKISGVEVIKSTYFGGGTPSLAQPEIIQKVINCVDEIVELKNNVEITLEYNPTSSELKLLSDFKYAGINRLSIGIQALNDSDLKLFGRNHNTSEALSCLETARSLFPGSVSVDLIFGRPGQTRESWISELSQMIKLCDDHLSLYQLTLERGTALFKKVQNKDLIMPIDDIVTDMYEDAIQILTEVGFIHYEVSNYARNGAESQHNNSYWNGTQYIGIGPGAHGRFVCQGIGRKNREARIQTLEPDNWMWEVEKFGHGTRKIVTQSTVDILEELLMLSLRTNKGINNEIWCQFSNDVSLFDVFGQSEELNDYIKNGYLLFDKMILKPTENGMKIADTITKDLLFYIQESTHLRMNQ